VSYEPLAVSKKKIINGMNENVEIKIFVLVLNHFLKQTLCGTLWRTQIIVGENTNNGGKR